MGISHCWLGDQKQASAPYQVSQVEKNPEGMSNQVLKN
jgi:hypothetical protein